MTHLCLLSPGETPELVGVGERGKESYRKGVEWKGGGGERSWTK